MGNATSVDLKKEISTQERDAIAAKWKGKMGLDQVNHVIRTYKNKNAVDAKTFKSGIKQLYAIMQTPALCEDSSDIVFRVFDNDHKNALTISNICDGLMLLTEGTEEQRIDAFFGMLDRNGDGYINKADVKAAISLLVKISAEVALKEAEQSGAKQGLSEWDVMSTFEPVIDKVNERLTSALIENIMLADRDGDKKITKENWRSESRTNENIRILSNAYVATHMYAGAYDFINQSDGAGTTQELPISDAELANAVHGESSPTMSKTRSNGVLTQEEIAQGLSDKAGFKLNLSSKK